MSESGTDKTAWIVDTGRHKLSQPDSNPDHRMITLVERMESAAASLIGGKQGIPPHPYNEAAVLQVEADTIKQGLDNGRVEASKGYVHKKSGGRWVTLPWGVVSSVDRWYLPRPPQSLFCCQGVSCLVAKGVECVSS